MANERKLITVPADFHQSLIDEVAAFHADRDAVIAKTLQGKVVELRTAHHDELQAVNTTIAAAVDNVIAKVHTSKLTTGERAEVIADLEQLKPIASQATTRAMSHLNEHLPNRSDV